MVITPPEILSFCSTSHSEAAIAKHSEWMYACMNDLRIHWEDKERVQTLVLNVLSRPINTRIVIKGLIKQTMKHKEAANKAWAFWQTLLFCHKYSLALVDGDCKMTRVFWHIFLRMAGQDTSKSYFTLLKCSRSWDDLSYQLAKQLALPPLEEEDECSSILDSNNCAGLIALDIALAIEDTYALYPPSTNEAVFAQMMREAVPLRIGYGRGASATQQGLQEARSRPCPQLEVEEDDESSYWEEEDADTWEAPVEAAAPHSPQKRLSCSTLVCIDKEQQVSKRVRRHNVLEDSEEEHCGFGLLTNPFETLDGHARRNQQYLKWWTSTL